MKLIKNVKERDQHLVNNWYIAALSSEIKNKGPLRVKIYDEDLVLFRDHNEKAVCVANRCLHRHALLSEGKIVDGQLMCPYHGWTYGGDGKLERVPSEGTPKTNKNFCLKTRPVLEQDGCLWVWMGDESPKPEHKPYKFPHWNEPGWTGYFMITDFENEVTHLAENFMDVPHTVYVHSKWFRNRKEKKVPISVEVDQGQVLVTYDQPNDSIGFTQMMMNPKKEPMKHTDLFIMPNITRVDYTFGSSRSFIINSQITPVSTLKSRVYTAIIYKLGYLPKLLKPFMHYYTRQVIQQDVEIMKNQGESFRNNFTLDFHATDADVVHVAIEKLRHMGEVGDPGLLDYKMKTQKNIWI